MWFECFVFVILPWRGLFIEDHLIRKQYLHRRTEELLSQLKHYETIIPQLTTRHGHFLSYDVTHSSVLRHAKSSHLRPKRQSEKNSQRTDDAEGLYFDENDHIGRSSIHYKLSAYGKHFRFNLSLNNQLLSKDFVVDFVGSDGLSQTSQDFWDCHYVGRTVGSDMDNTAISNCQGLHGVFSTESEDYFVEPLWNHTNEVEVQGHPHIVYTRSSLKMADIGQHCGVTDYRRRKYIKFYRKRPGSYNSVLHKPKHQHPYWQWRPKAKRRKIYRGKRKRYYSRHRRRRSVSRERHVETVVVVDKKMMDYHTQGQSRLGKESLSTYVLTIMNIVATLFHNPSIGNDVNIIVTRLIVLGEEKGKNLPHITHHADRSLDSFCKWQHDLRHRHNTSVSHDNAVLITRYDICTYKNKPCGTLGLAPVGSMCEDERSCSINQDIGLASAFTIAHEIGHNFGMHHDGAGNKCGLSGQEPARLMAARLTKETSPFHWSSCSRKYITDFLDSGKGDCLNNVPLKREAYPRVLPSDQYGIDDQCRLQFGSQSKACKMKHSCKELWCIGPDESCVTNNMPAAEGTACDMANNKTGWCFHGECRNPKYESQTIHGSWSQWQEWGDCSRTCEGGVATSQRECDNPSPRDGGKYCIGQRKRYRSCNVTPCPQDSVDFRQVQCSDFNPVTFRGRQYNWVPYSGGEAVFSCVHGGGIQLLHGEVS